VENLAIQGIWKTLRAFESTPLRTQLARHHGTAVDSMFHGWSDVWLSPEYQTWNMLDRLGAISAPVLAIQGEDDEYGTVCQVRAILDRVAGPAEGLLIPACAHVPHFQARERVLANMTRFIQGTIHPGKKA
jgi:pimeloyl-ACP methyl ester carboxylesterase